MSCLLIKQYQNHLQEDIFRHLRMMTVKLMAMATLMSTFITESMCLILIIIVLLRIANIYVEVFVELNWATVPSPLGQPQYKLVTKQLYPPKIMNVTEMLPKRAAFLETHLLWVKYCSTRG